MALKNMAVPNVADDLAEMANPYGFGLLIRLNPEQCDILGLKSPPVAGTMMSIKAMACTTSVTQEVDAGESEKELYLELQITDLELTHASNASKSASMLYGDDAEWVRVLGY